MTTIPYHQNRAHRTGQIFFTMILLMTVCVACGDEANHSVPTELPGTTWKFDDFSITFISKSALSVHGEDARDVLAEGTYAIIEDFIEVTVGDRVRAGSWDGERLMIDGMVGRLTGTSS